MKTINKIESEKEGKDQSIKPSTWNQSRDLKP